MRKTLMMLAAFATATTFAACGGSSDTSGTVADTAAGAGQTTAATTESTPNPYQLTLMTPGTLTVGTELPDPPMVIADTYDQIKDNGYEVEMVNEIARRAGGLTVKWVQFPFDGAIAGKDCPCDLYVDGVTIYDDRKEKVDFSSGYFKTNQGLLVRSGTAVADLATAATLQLGVTKDSSGQYYVDNTLKPAKKARVYDSPTAAFLALKAHQVDGLVLDVTTAVDGANKTKGEVAGQIETGEEYGIVMKKGGPNTVPVTQLVDALNTEGFFAPLLAKYTPDLVAIPVLK
jgi:polar amino acid transport system substrate-binding protein